MRTIVRSRIPLYMAISVMVIANFVCFDAYALTVSEYLSSAQSWWNNRDDGAFTHSISIYDVDPTQGNSESSIASGTVYFKDYATGWCKKVELTFQLGDYGTPVYKLLDTPDGEQAFFNGECVYPDQPATGYLNPSHSSIPNVFYDGIASHTNLQAVQAVTTSNVASATTLDGISVYKLECTYSNSALNARNDGDDIAANDVVSDIQYIKASNGEPMRTIATHYNAENALTAISKTYISNMNTSPTIPSDTFTLTSDVPSRSFEEALLDFFQ